MPTPERAPVSWHLTLDQRRAALERRLADLSGWRDRFRSDVDGWTFAAPGAAPVPITLGAPWPVVDPAVANGPVVFEAAFAIPGAWAGRPVELELDLGGEGLVRLSSGATGGLNPFHRAFPVHAAPGETVHVWVEAVPKGLFGAPTPRPSLAVARLVVPEPDVRALCADLAVVLSAAKELAGPATQGHDAAPHLLRAAEDALAGLPWPSATGEYLARIDRGIGVDAEGIWHLPEDRPAPTPPAEEVVEGARAARARLRADLAALREVFPPSGALAPSGHAHLDLAWLWPLAETRRKAERTFETVLGLMDEFPDFTFNQSSAQLYAWIEAERPDLFERVRRRVAEGRWEAVGGMWVEPDLNMAGGESLARQLLYGQRYFREKFGRPSTVAWLPDTFGFTAALPQLLRLAGIPGFFTTKLSWNETTAFPHDLWRWEGLDGSTVVGHAFKNDFWGTPGLGSYNGDVSPEHLMRVWRHDRAKAASAWRGRAPEALFTYGFGDGAGGPSREMLSRVDLLREFPALPRLRHVRVDDFFAALPQDDLPRWRGELYFELHRATLSTQGRLKKLHREAEHRLAEAEAAGVLTGRGADFGARLGEQWRSLLLHEFHDILPGSSIREVYAEAEPTLAGVVAEATAARDAALAGEGAGDKDGWRVWNLDLFDRPLLAFLPGEAGGVQDAAGRPLAAQAVEGGLLVSGMDAVPALGAAVLRPAPGAAAVPALGPAGVRVFREGDRTVLENAALRAEFDAGGTLRRLFDRARDREALSALGAPLVAFKDVPRAWEAWDLNPDVQDPALGETLPDGEVEVVEEGPVRAAVRVVRRWRGSRVEQTFSLALGAERLDVAVRLDWHERRTLLKQFFGLEVRADVAHFETAFGVVARPTHRNRPADAARFEGAARRFAALVEPGFGVAVLNDGRHGHSALGSALGVTLVRGPLWPDPLADEGDHAFALALRPLGGDLWDATREAIDLNSPLVAAPGGAASPPPLRVSGLPVALGALKPAEDGGATVLRFYEPRGARGKVTLHLPAGTGVARLDLLEDPAPDASVPEERAPGEFTLAVRPFEVVTLGLRFPAKAEFDVESR